MTLSPLSVLNRTSKSTRPRQSRSGDRKNVRAKDREECCEVLPFGYNMATVLMNSNQLSLQALPKLKLVKSPVWMKEVLTCLTPGFATDN